MDLGELSKYASTSYRPHSTWTTPSFTGWTYSANVFAGSFRVISSNSTWLSQSANQVPDLRTRRQPTLTVQSLTYQAGIAKACKGTAADPSAWKFYEERNCVRMSKSSTDGRNWCEEYQAALSGGECEGVQPRVFPSTDNGFGIRSNFSLPLARLS